MSIRDAIGVFNFIFTLPLSFPSCFSMFSGRCITVRPKALSVDGWYPATPGRSRSLINFYRLQPRFRLQAKQPTPTKSNSDLDSDSAALLKRELTFNLGVSVDNLVLNQNFLLQGLHKPKNKTQSLTFRLTLSWYANSVSKSKAFFWDRHGESFRTTLCAPPCDP